MIMGVNLRTAALVAAAAVTGLIAPAATAGARGVDASAAPPVLSASATTSASPTVAPTPEPTPEPAPCKGAMDARAGSAKNVPFTVCGVEVISKKHRVTSAYKPKLVTVKVAKSGLKSVQMQAQAGVALQRMFAAAKRAGHTLAVRYAYRSYSWQQAAYRRDHVLTAPAGASEHQSGLAVDLSAFRGGREYRGFQFGTSAAGRWVKSHAAEFGFIIRYPDGRKAITGFSYEPWHVRFAGVDVARQVVASPTGTLERTLHVD